MIPVNSSNLAAVGYDPWSGVLVIEFHGGRVYEYSHVPARVYAELMAAGSLGRYFHAYIRHRYRYRRIS